MNRLFQLSALVVAVCVCCFSDYTDSKSMAEIHGAGFMAFCDVSDDQAPTCIPLPGMSCAEVSAKKNWVCVSGQLPDRIGTKKWKCMSSGCTNEEMTDGAGGCTRPSFKCP